MASNPYFLNWQEVKEQILSFLPPAWRLTTGKVLTRLITAIALAIESLYALLVKVLRLSIIATSEGRYLRALVAGFGMTAYVGTYAQVYVQFYRSGDLSESVTIPLNTQVGAVYGQQFRTVVTAVIPAEQSSVEVLCECTEPGVKGRIGSGEILGLTTGAVKGVTQVTNANAAFGGNDPESDDEIKARVPKYLETLHRATIPATEYAISINRSLFPEVEGFITQRSYGTPGYFRGILTDGSGGDIYRAQSWTLVGNGVWFCSTGLTEVNGLVAAGYPCKRFGVVTRSTSGEEIWNASSFVAEVEQGDWRFCFDSFLGRLYARADGSDLNDFDVTIVSGVVYRALRELETRYCANGVFCDVIVPFVVRDTIRLSYTLEPGYVQSTVENNLRTAVSAYVAALNLGQSLQLEELYAALNKVLGAGATIVTYPTSNITVGADSVFRLSSVPQITRRSA